MGWLLTDRSAFAQICSNLLELARTRSNLPELARTAKGNFFFPFEFLFLFFFLLFFSSKKITSMKRWRSRIEKTKSEIFSSAHDWQLVEERKSSRERKALNGEIILGITGLYRYQVHVQFLGSAKNLGFSQKKRKDTKRREEEERYSAAFSNEEEGEGLKSRPSTKKK